MEDFIKKVTPEEAQEIAEKQIEEIEKTETEKRIIAMKEFAKRRSEEVRDNFNNDKPMEGSSFLLLITYLDGDTHWEICDDRETAYYFLKNGIEDIDLLETHVIPETLPFSESITAFEALTHWIDSGKIVDEENPIDPRDYVKGDVGFEELEEEE